MGVEKQSSQLGAGKILESLGGQESLAQVLVDNCRDSMWVRDLNLRPIYVSPAVKQIAGYTPEEDLQVKQPPPSCLPCPLAMPL